MSIWFDITNYGMSGSINTNRWFTLIEILFVIVIISLLLWSVFFFGSQRIAELSTKTYVEEFVQFYDRVHLENLSSSYIWTGRYDSMTIGFTDNQQVVSVNYLFHNQPVYSDQFTLGGTMLFDVQTPFVIKQVPFSMWCTITPSAASSLSIVSRMGDRYCFAIIPDSCRLDTVLCPH